MSISTYISESEFCFFFFFHFLSCLVVPGEIARFLVLDLSNVKSNFNFLKKFLFYKTLFSSVPVTSNLLSTY